MIQSLEFKALCLIFGIVVLLAVPTTYSIVAETKPNAPQEVKPVATLKPPPQRTIASVKVPIVSSIQSDDQFAVVMDYRCKEDREVVVSSETLRFKGHSDDCLNEKWKDVSITNSTNGFTAEVIFHQNGYTTDFIDLKEGNNQLVLKATTNDGSPIVRKINVLKRKIASEAVED